MKNQKMLSIVLYSMKLFAGISSDDPKVIIEEFYHSKRVLTKNALMMFPALYLIWMDDYQKKIDYITDLFPFAIRFEKHSEDKKFPAAPVLVSLSFEKFLEESIGLSSNDRSIGKFEIPEGFELDNFLDSIAKRIDRGIQTPALSKEDSINMVYWNCLVIKRHIGVYAYMFELGDQICHDIQTELSFYSSILLGTQMYHTFSVPREVIHNFRKQIEGLIGSRNDDPAVAQILGYFPNGYVVQSFPKGLEIEK